jgi:hypothetical protein
LIRGPPRQHFEILIRRWRRGSTSSTTKVSTRAADAHAARLVRDTARAAEKLVGDIGPETYAFHRHKPSLFTDAAPQVAFIRVLRNPVGRGRSYLRMPARQQNIGLGWVPPSMIVAAKRVPRLATFSRYRAFGGRCGGIARG